MLELDIVGFQELAPGRSVVEKVADREIGADGSRHRGGLRPAFASGADLRGGFVARPSGPERHFGDGRDAREGLAPEAVGHDFIEILRGGYLRRGVPLETEHGVGSAHAAAVVYDLYERASGVGDYDGDLRGSRVDSVLHELLDHRCRALDDLARGYHVGDLRGKNFETAHRPGL